MERMYTEATEHLHVGGSLYVVIHKKHGAETTQKKLQELFRNCHTLYKKKGIFVFQATRLD
jgi:16S rRNA (guanine1207-N2)-methyltransferase